MARITLRHRLLDALTGAVIGLARLLPYRARLAAMGGFGHAVLGPLLPIMIKTKTNSKPLPC